MRILLVISLIVFTGNFCYAQDNVTMADTDTQTNKAYLKDGKIVLENEQGARTIDYDERTGQSAYGLKQWDVKEEKLDTVSEALKVYQNKGNPLYQKKVWIFNKQDGSQSLLVEYATSDGSDKVIFSPDEQFMYFLGIGGDGVNMVYGVNLTSNNRFEIGSGYDFNIIDCPNKKNYIVVKKTQDDAGNTYIIYNQYGQQQRALDSIVDIGDIEKNLCY